MFTKSIRWRILLWLAFLLVCILSGFGLTAYQLQRLNQLNQLDDILKRHVALISADVRGRPPGPPPGERRPGPGPGPGRPPPDEEFFNAENERRPPERRPPPDGGFRGPSGPKDRGPGRPDMSFGPRRFTLRDQTLSLFDETDTNAFYFAVWSRGGTLARSSTNGPTPLALPNGSEADTRPDARTRGVYREAFHFTEMGECILVGRSMTSDLAALHQFAWWLVAAGGGILVLGLGGGWWLASSALRPIGDMTAAAGRISEGNLAERINVTETDSELGHLAGVLNTTFARLDAAFAQQKQFTADASHELRTPLAVLISEAQTTLARDRSSAEYRETIEACLTTAQQMRRLTERLLQLARLDAGESSLEHGTVDLAECAARCIEQIHPLAAERGLTMSAELEPAKATGDAELLSQVITNLLTNAIHYNKEQGEIRVVTKLENGEAILCVSDTGSGISGPDLPHVFKRFYRADKSRARANGRTGLGLAICKAIVDSHGGRIEVASEPGKGTTFTVRLPA